MKKIILFLSGGLLVLWIAGIILVNLFDIDIDKPGSLYNSNYFLTLLVFLVFLVLILFAVSLLRHKGEKERTQLEGKERLGRIFAYFGVGVSLPVGLTAFFVVVFSWLDIKKYFDPQYDSFAIDIIGTLLSLSGLPFIIRMLRLIRSELKAVWVAILLIPYGLLLWVACLLLMMGIFNRVSCC